MPVIAGYAKKLGIPVLVVSHDYSMREYFDISIEMFELNEVNKQC